MKTKTILYSFLKACFIVVFFLPLFGQKITTLPILENGVVRGGTYSSVAYGTPDSLVAKRGFWGTDSTRVPYLKFSIATTPAAGNIKKAVLRMYVLSRESNTINTVWLVRNDSWSASTLTFENQPLVTDAHYGIMAIDTKMKNEPAGHANITGSGRWVEFDVSAALRSRRPDSSFITFVIHAIEMPATTYASAAQIDRAPQLVITEGTPETVTTSTHPRVLTTKEKKKEIVKKINDYSWARNSYTGMINSIDEYADKHLKNPEYYLSRMPMFWTNHYSSNHRKGSTIVADDKYNWMLDGHGGFAPVPTFIPGGERFMSLDGKMPGFPGWERIVPFRDDGYLLCALLNPATAKKDIYGDRTLGNSGYYNMETRIQFFIRAQDAAFLWYITGNEKYAKIAADFVWQMAVSFFFVQTPAPGQPDDWTVPHKNSVGQGSIESQIIDDDRSMRYYMKAYDFVSDYLEAQGKDTFIIDYMLRQMCERFINTGWINNNMAVWKSRCMTLAASCLEGDDAYGDGRGREYYYRYLINTSHFNKDLSRITMVPVNEQIALQWNMDTFLQDEPPSYAVGTLGMAVEIAKLMTLQKADLFRLSPVLLESPQRFMYLLDPSYSSYLCFGDSTKATYNPVNLETILSYAKDYNDHTLYSKISSQLSIVYESQTRSPSGLDALCWFEPKITPSSGNEEFVLPRMTWDYGHQLIIQRGTEKGIHGVSAALVGNNLGGHVHLNGLSMEVTAFGNIPIFPDTYDDAYGTPQYEGYGKLAAGHNSITVDAVQPAANLRLNISNIEPALYNDGLHYSLNGSEMNKNFSFVDVATFDSKRNTDFRRMNAVIQTSAKNYYLLDIFRAKKRSGTDNRQTYLLHPMGQTVRFTTLDGATITTTPGDYLGSAFGDDGSYNHLTEEAIINTTNDFLLSTDIPSTRPYTMHNAVWMMAATNRTLYFARGPKAIGSINRVPQMEPLWTTLNPVLAVRQRQHSWNQPFISVIAPYLDNKPSVSFVKEIKNLPGAGVVKGVVVESEIVEDGLIKQIVDNLFYSLSTNFLAVSENIKFKGIFGVARFQNNEFSELYLGKGVLLEVTNAIKIESKTGKIFSASAIALEDGFSYSATERSIVRVVYQNESKDVPYLDLKLYYKYNNEWVRAESSSAIPGSGVVTQGIGEVIGTVPAMNKGELKISANSSFDGTRVKIKIVLNGNEIPYETSSLSVSSGFKFQSIITCDSPVSSESAVVLFNDFPLDSDAYTVSKQGIYSLIINLDSSLIGSGILKVDVDNGTDEIFSRSIFVQKNENGSLFPNPYSSQSGALLEIIVPSDSVVSDVFICQMNGTVIATLNKPVDAKTFWNGMGDDGKTPGSGLYFVVYQGTDGKSSSTKLIFSREEK